MVTGQQPLARPGRRLRITDVVLLAGSVFLIIVFAIGVPLFEQHMRHKQLALIALTEFVIGFFRSLYWVFAAGIPAAYALAPLIGHEKLQNKKLDWMLLLVQGAIFGFIAAAIASQFLLPVEHGLSG